MTTSSSASAATTSWAATAAATVGGPGDDTFFRYQAADEGVDRIVDFSADDVLRLDEVLQGFTAAADPNDFVRPVESGNDTTVRVNADGTGTDFTALARLVGFTGANLDDLIAGGQVVLSDGGTA